MREESKDKCSPRRASAFSHDIVATVPSEIVVLIFQQLPIAQYIQARLISKKWRSILSSSDVLKPLIYSMCPRESAYLTSDKITLSLDDLCRRLNAYQQGKPFASAILPLSAYDSPVAYTNKILALTDDKMHTLKLMHLVTGDETFLISPKGIDFEQIAISQAIAAALDGLGCCYVWDMLCPSRLPTSLHLGPEGIQNFSVASETVVMVSAAGKVTTYRCGLFTVFQIPGSYSRGDERLSRSQLLVNSAGDEIHFFYFSQAWVRHMSFDLHGNVTAESEIRFTKRDDCCPWKANNYRGTILQSPYSTIWSFMRQQPSHWDLSRVCFDYRHRKLKIDSQILYDVPHVYMNWEFCTPFFWNDIGYFWGLGVRNGTDEELRLNVIDVKTSTCRVVKCERLWGWKIRDLVDSGFLEDEEFFMDSLLDSSFFGDGEYLINSSRYGVCVFSFEPEVKMAAQFQDSGLVRL